MEGKNELQVDYRDQRSYIERPMQTGVLMSTKIYNERK